MFRRLASRASQKRNNMTGYYKQIPRYNWPLTQVKKGDVLLAKGYGFNLPPPHPQGNQITPYLHPDGRVIIPQAGVAVEWVQELNQCISIKNLAESIWTISGQVGTAWRWVQLADTSIQNGSEGKYVPIHESMWGAKITKGLVLLKKGWGFPGFGIVFSSKPITLTTGKIAPHSNCLLFERIATDHPTRTIAYAASQIWPNGNKGTAWMWVPHASVQSEPSASDNWQEEWWALRDEDDVLVGDSCVPISKNLNDSKLADWLYDPAHVVRPGTEVWCLRNCSFDFAKDNGFLVFRLHRSLGGSDFHPVLANWWEGRDRRLNGNDYYSQPLSLP